jgi:heme oxygenase
MDPTETPIDLASALRTRTEALHRRAERTGVIAGILAGQTSRRAYTLFLRNLLPAYQVMEIGLERHRLTPGVGEFARPEVYRSNALEADLINLEGRGWREALPLLPAGARYAACVSTATKGDGVALIGHAYVRYLGDLSGGQILKRLLTKSLSIKPAALSFYDFPDIRDMGAYKQTFREALNRSTWNGGEDRVIDAAIAAFTMNLSLSESVWAAAPAPPNAFPVARVAAPMEDH